MENHETFRLYVLVPGVIFIVDKIVTLRTRYIALDILETELLPSDVLKCKFYRPPNMKVLSGNSVINYVEVLINQ
jgi:dual oxidase